MTAPIWIGLVLGLTLGAGVLMAYSVIRRKAMPTLLQRVEPALRSTEQASTQAAIEPTTNTLAQLLSPVIDGLLQKISVLNFDNAKLRRRLQESGQHTTVTEFRSQQVVLAVSGLILAVVITGLMAVNQRFNPVFSFVLCIGLALVGFLLSDYLLGQKISRRKARILTEFPTIAELMALAIAAGDTARGALQRIATTADGEMAAEFRLILAETHSGVPLHRALRNGSDRINTPAVDRFISGIIVALERGTPLSQVIRAQAHDARQFAKRELMEDAGKKEIAMLLPVVFGIMPLTVIFALFPGASLLRLGF